MGNFEAAIAKTDSVLGKFRKVSEIRNEIDPDVFKPLRTLHKPSARRLRSKDVMTRC